jgi:hypothetical protein
LEELWAQRSSITLVRGCSPLFNNNSACASNPPELQSISSWSTRQHTQPKTDISAFFRCEVSPAPALSIRSYILQSAVLLAAFAVLTPGASAAPIPALPLIDSSQPSLVSRAYSSFELFPDSFAQDPHQPSALPLFNGAVPQLLSPTSQALADFAEPPGILAGLGALAVTLGIVRRPRTKRRRRRRIFQLRKLASI